MQSIFFNIKKIIIDKYGNYVIQYIIKNIIVINDENRKVIKNFNWNEIFKFILDDFVNYSNQKYSSNVIEKIFMIDELKPKMIEKLKNPEITRNLIFEKYGNYVIQKGLHFAEDKDKDIILQIIGYSSEDIQKVEFGKKLINKLMTKYPKLINFINDSQRNQNDLNENLIKINENKDNHIINDTLKKDNNNANNLPKHKNIQNNDAYGQIYKDKNSNDNTTKIINNDNL